MNTEFKGIDVSKWQGKIDWSKVKKDEVDFAMLRCGFGKTEGQEDQYFEENYKNAKANGIPVGAYHYSYATTAEGAKEEALYCLSLLRGKQFEFPIAFDIEESKQQNLSNETLTKIIEAFCDTLENEGYYVCVYVNLWWLNNKIESVIPKQYDIWLAQWADAPTYEGDFGMWQYTSGGSVNGIAGRVDMNLAYKNYPNIMRVNGLNGFSKSGDTFPPRRMISLNNTPLYISATAKEPAVRKSGTFYIYDGKEINGRYRITSSAERAEKLPVSQNVTGYVEKSDIR